METGASRSESKRGRPFLPEGRRPAGAGGSRTETGLLREILPRAAIVEIPYAVGIVVAGIVHARVVVDHAFCG